MFRHHTYFVQHGHEGGIAVPARHKMEVHVLSDARACGLAQVQSHIDALAVETIFKNNGTFLQQVHEFTALFRGEGGEFHHMAVGRHQEMTVAVRKFVHQHENMPASVENESFGILSPMFGNTEDTGIGFGTQNIFDAPWRPKLFHIFGYTPLAALYHQYGGGYPTRVVFHGQVFPQMLS